MKTMKSKIYLLLILSAITGMIFLQNCKHEPYGPIPKPVVNDTTNHHPVDTTHHDSTVTGTPCSKDTAYFQNTINPLIQSYCSKSGCHDANTTTDYNLTTYSLIMGIVKPSNAAGSKLYRTITGADDQMPPTSSPQLTSAQIQLIYTWIQQGAKNNKCTGCDTSVYSYSKAVQPVMQTYCTGCHSASLASGGVNLDNYVGIAAVASNGKLYGTIAHISGYKTMPLGSASVPTCQITKIKKWVDSGYPNN